MIDKNKINENIIIDKETGCFHWVGSMTNNRPVLYIEGRRVYMRSYVYEWQKGLIPSGFFVILKCGNSDCVNPKHMGIKTNMPSKTTATLDSKP